MYERSQPNPEGYQPHQRKQIRKPQPTNQLMTPKTKNNPSVIAQSNIHHSHMLLPSKKPSKGQSSTRTSLLRPDTPPLQEQTLSKLNLREQQEYVQHLRNILLRLQQTTSILQMNRQKNKRLYSDSLILVFKERDELRQREKQMMMQIEELNEIVEHKSVYHQ